MSNYFINSFLIIFFFLNYIIILIMQEKFLMDYFKAKLIQPRDLSTIMPSFLSNFMNTWKLTEIINKADNVNRVTFPYFIFIFFWFLLLKLMETIIGWFYHNILLLKLRLYFICYVKNCTLLLIWHTYVAGKLMSVNKDM